MVKKKRGGRASYIKGVRAERRVACWLTEVMNWPIVIRSAGSKGPFDLVAVSRLGIAAMFQVKSGEKPSTRGWSKETRATLRKLDVTITAWLVWIPDRKDPVLAACEHFTSSLSKAAKRRNG